MKKEPVIGLHSLNNCVLVELQQSHKNVNVKEGKYDTRTEGIVVGLPEKLKSFKTATYAGGVGTSYDGFDMPKDLLGKRVHFEEFKEGARIKRNGKIYSFIKVEDIRGYEVE